MSQLLRDEVIDRALASGFDRKTFLKGSGALVVGFGLAGTVLTREAKAAGETRAAGPPPAGQIDSWIVVHEDNTCSIAIGKIELGQGTPTGLAMIAAEELDLTMDQVRYVRCDTDVTPNQGVTAGSSSISGGGTQVRQAAAEARAVLLGLASKALGVPVSDLTVNAAVVSSRSDPSKSILYGQLLGGKTFSAPNTGRAPRKAVADYKLVGTRQQRHDIPDKVWGKYIYVQNLRLEGMLHGRVVRPRGQGAWGDPVRAISVDESSIANIKGARLIRKGDFIGVVAANEQDAIQAAAQLKVQWANTERLASHGSFVAEYKTRATFDRFPVNRGNLATGFSKGVREVSGAFGFAYQSHAAFGPSAAVADVQGTTATVMMAGQNIYGTRTTIAGILGLPANNVRIQFWESAGCYGRNLQDDAAQAAAVMSQIVGAPVRVQMMRWDEHGWDFYSTPDIVELRAAIDADNRIVAYDYKHWGAQWLGVETTAQTVGTPIPAPGNSSAETENAGNQYNIPHCKVTAKTVPSNSGVLKTAYLRAPGATQALFASEQVIDQLAYDANLDPIQFRSWNSRNPRWNAVLDAVAASAKWKPARAGRGIGKTSRIRNGRGVAIGGFASTFAAVIADIEVDTMTGKIRCKHLYAAQDCGLIINPELVEAQIMGCLIQGTSRALIEEVKFNRSRVTSLDWDSYPILRFKDHPEVTITLVNRPDLPSSGSGEPATAPVSAAIANAFFDATGLRLHAAPMNPSRVRKVLKG